MHKDFGEWYRLVNLEPVDETMRKRWAAIEDWQQSSARNIDHVLELVRMFRDRPVYDSDARESFLSLLLKHDAAFPKRNELELRVLAGAALVQCIILGKDEENDTPGVIAAMALATSMLRGISKPSRLRDIENIAATLQCEIADDRRRRQRTEDALIDPSVGKAIEQLTSTATPDHNQLKNQLLPVFQEFLKALERAEVALDAADHDSRCADEECNMLWWLEGGCSRDLRTPWTELSNSAVSIVAGKELADLTSQLPGPDQAEALLHKVLSATRCPEATLEDAVNSVPREWLPEAADREISAAASDLVPVCLALSQRAASGDSGWQTFFKETTDLSLSQKIAPVVLAQQMYAERLLLRAISEGED